MADGNEGFGEVGRNIHDSQADEAEISTLEKISMNIRRGSEGGREQQGGEARLAPLKELVMLARRALEDVSPFQ